MGIANSKRVVNRGFHPLTGAMLLLLATCCGGLVFGQDAELSSMAEQIKRLDQIMSSPLADETQFLDAKAELDAMLIRTQDMVSNKGENATSRRLLAVQEDLLRLRKLAIERLPDTDSGAGSGRRGPRTGFPLPEFGEKRLVGLITDDLRKAQLELYRHLSKEKPDGAATDGLLVAMILAEEKLAWEAGWPFTAEEGASIKSTDGEVKLTEEVYLSRRNRGIHRINELIRQQYGSVGRDMPSTFVIHSPTSTTAQTKIDQWMQKERGIGFYWVKGTLAFDDSEKEVLLGRRRREAASPTEPEKPAETADPPATDPRDFPLELDPLDDSRPGTPRVAAPRKPVVRTWSDASGEFSVRAVLVSRTGDKVKLRRESDNETIEVSFSELAPSDQKYIESLRR